MPSPREILVVTTSTLDGIHVKQYLKPVSSHIVSGINVFNDLFGSFTDIFGGRSNTYQRQLTSLYSEAIERIKYAAYEIGADGILGMHIDIDEIAGKGKSMLMITASGTAVVLDRSTAQNANAATQKPDMVGVEQLHVLRNKNKLLEKANAGELPLNEETWRFLIANAPEEFYPYIMGKYPDALAQEQMNPESTAEFTRSLASYLDALPDSKKKELLYGSLTSGQKEPVLRKLYEFIRQWNLYDKEYIDRLLQHPDFTVQKRGLMAVASDKPFYNRQDVEELENMKKYVHEHFTERGQRTTKQGLLSSKEKAVWKCECGKTNDIETYCGGCKQDIYGCKANELAPPTVVKHLENKIQMIVSQLG